MKFDFLFRIQLSLCGTDESIVVMYDTLTYGLSLNFANQLKK